MFFTVTPRSVVSNCTKLTDQVTLWRRKLTRISHFEPSSKHTTSELQKPITSQFRHRQTSNKQIPSHCSYEPNTHSLCTPWTHISCRHSATHSYLQHQMTKPHDSATTQGQRTAGNHWTGGWLNRAVCGRDKPGSVAGSRPGAVQTGALELLVVLQVT